MEKIDLSESRGVKLLTLRSLNQSELLIYHFLLKKCGQSMVPINVPFIQMANYFKLSINQVGYIVRKLIKGGLIERFIKYDNPAKKKNYYRIPI